MSRYGNISLATLSTVAALLFAAPAVAFDGGPHASITQDAMQAEGFGPSAASVAQVEGWFVDFYDSTPGAVAFVANLPASAREAAKRMHFASTCVGDGDGCGTAHGIEAEWRRLERATAGTVRRARLRNDTIGFLAALGASVHELQDFYSHSNWVLPSSGGYDGPGWVARGYGSSPTWYDVPESVRDSARVYVAGAPGSPRSHGNWNSNPLTSLNMDWQGRPYYNAAYIAAYFATRTWIRAVRSWVGNEAFWHRAQAFSAYGSDLSYDLTASRKIATYSGHWYGQGEPTGGPAPGVGGSLDDLLAVGAAYLGHGPTIFRRAFERIVPVIGAGNPPGLQPSPRPGSSTLLQRQTRFVRLRIPYVEGLGAGDPGPWDQADFYARASIGGRSYYTEFIHGRDKFTFPAPNAPFTLIRALPSTATFAEPLTELRVTIRTADVTLAGTNDNVYLRISNGRRFLLNKPGYDDFERGDIDTYSLPVDGLTSGLTLGDIRYIQLEKGPDGIAGGWKFTYIGVYANGRQIYHRDHVDTWLEDNHLTWRAPDFTPTNPVSHAIPVWIALYDDDGGLYGADDHADINPSHARYNVGVAYTPPTTWPVIQTTGGDALGGRILGDANRARIKYQLDTLSFTAPPLRRIPR